MDCNIMAFLVLKLFESGRFQLEVKRQLLKFLLELSQLCLPELILLFAIRELQCHDDRQLRCLIS